MSPWVGSVCIPRAAVGEVIDRRQHTGRGKLEYRAIKEAATAHSRPVEVTIRGLDHLTERLGAIAVIKTNQLLVCALRGYPINGAEVTGAAILGGAVEVTIAAEDKAAVRHVTVGSVIEAVEYRHHARGAKLVNRAGARAAAHCMTCYRRRRRSQGQAALADLRALPIS